MQFSLTAFFSGLLIFLKRFSTSKIGKSLEIYTDGSSKGAFGSWAYVVARGRKCISENSGRVRRANSNTMEFQAAIEALTSIPANSKAILYSDSRVLVDAMKFGDGPRAHQGQIEVLKRLCDQHQVKWQWVKAHNGNKLNERCDELCTLARNTEISRGL